MPTTYYRNLRGGHCPGHVREAFCSALYAFEGWPDGTPEPTVYFEVNYEPRQILISKVCGLVWNCSDILPREMRSILQDTGLFEDMRSCTYGAAARVMRAHILELTRSN